MKETEVKERPILFSGPMVRAILEGRKTQTRRVVKAKHLPFLGNLLGGFLDGRWNQRPLPYGRPGDRLWVRETWAWCSKARGHWLYRADDSDLGTCHVKDGRWKPSIHMKRAASRITLEVVAVRVERLQEITPGDAIAEGCPGGDHGDRYAAIDQYRALWGSINGAGSWAANPWVWVVEFRKVEGGGGMKARAKHKVRQFRVKGLRWSPAARHRPGTQEFVAFVMRGEYRVFRTRHPIDGTWGGWRWTFGCKEYSTDPSSEFPTAASTKEAAARDWVDQISWFLVPVAAEPRKRKEVAR